MTPGLWASTRAALRALYAAGVPIDRYGPERRVIDAEHEAAHAALALLLGCRVLRIEIDAADQPVTSWRPAPTPEVRALIHVAGEVVEDRYRRATATLPARIAAVAALADAGDRDAEACDLRVFTRHARLRGLGAEFYRRAAVLLHRNAALVAEIAEPLYTRGRLSAVDIDALPEAGRLQRLACG